MDHKLPESVKLEVEKYDSGSTCSSDTSGNTDNEREHWSGKLDSLLSFLGYAVGLGNLWRFPYLCMRNGGGAFLIPFLIFLVLCGLPLYFLELSLGQFTGKSASHAWEVCPIFKGVGVGMVIAIGIIGLYYNVIIAWTLFYIGNSFISPLPWSTCSNDWNTDTCGVRIGNNTDTNSSFILSVTGLDLHNSTNDVSPTFKGLTSEEEFWQYKVLNMSSGLEVIGRIPWHLAVCFFAAWILVYLCLIKGVKSIGKVVYVTATLPYILLTVILVRGLTLPGAVDGVLFYLTPDFSRLTDMQVWIEAALQVFYSLGPAWGPMITMASYNKFNNNCYRDAIVLTFMSEGTSIYAGLVVFSVLGFMANKASLPISEIAKSGPGLGFIAYPEALAQLPFPNLWAALFFIMLLTVGLDSQFVHIEAVCTAFTDTFPALRRKRMIFTAILCALWCLFGLLICTQGGIYIFQMVDWYVASISLPLFGLLEAVVIGWFYGAENFSRDIRLMLNRGVPVFMRVCWCFVTPAVLLFLLLFTLSTYKPPTYGDYVYPGYTSIIGFILAMIPIIPLPVCALMTIRGTPGQTLMEKLVTSFKPSPNWKPVSQAHAKRYSDIGNNNESTFIGVIKRNILGDNIYSQ
ncbi:sodium- and chloride-dependent glycine transporter 2-like [Ylistrum balloti]|uniref:sodium- and chloride-dependent glycine transporter 2-like n=1 Tax=Ylistrum balloti TaxID=509963 RepID=UPI00290598AF|nr:sodium- and chloride-dependent glycine transporter 2-like [Ylistrum balloti]